MAIFVIFFASVLTLHLLGRSVRRYAEKDASISRVTVVATTPDVYRRWKSAGLKGRVVVSMSRFLHFVSVPAVAGEPQPLRGFAEEKTRLQDGWERRLDYRNFLLVAMKTNIVRELHQVVPPEVFAVKKQEALRRKGNGERVDADVIRNNYLSLNRTIGASLPASEEPVLLNIDASFFRDADPEQVLRLVRSAGVKADVVTLCLAEDNPDVSPAERARLKELARLFDAPAAGAVR